MRTATQKYPALEDSVRRRKEYREDVQRYTFGSGILHEQMDRADDEGATKGEVARLSKKVADLTVATAELAASVETNSGGADTFWQDLGFGWGVMAGASGMFLFLFILQFFVNHGII